MVHSRRREQQQRCSVPQFGLQATVTICLSLHTSVCSIILIAVKWKTCVYRERGRNDHKRIRMAGCKTRLLSVRICLTTNPPAWLQWDSFSGLGEKKPKAWYPRLGYWSCYCLGLIIEDNIRMKYERVQLGGKASCLRHVTCCSCCSCSLR